MTKGLDGVPESLEKFYYTKDMLDSSGQSSSRKFARFDASIVFSYMEIGGFILKSPRKDLEDLQKLFRSQLGLYWDNPNLRFSNIYGEEFSVSVYDNIHVWDHRGQISIGTYPATEEGVAKMLKDSEDYTQGVMYCGGCGHKVKRSEIAGHFYAGSYCATCWNEGWTDEQGRKHENMKAVESRENYD